MIQTSQADMITNNEFDTIYHEHLSFFNTSSMKKCANINKGFLWLMSLRPISMARVMYLCLKRESIARRNQLGKSPLREAGLFELETYTKYAEKCHTIATDLQAAIADFKQKNCKIVGYGAAAKGNTFF